MADEDHRPFLRARLLRYFVCLELQRSDEPLAVRDLVAALERSGFRIKGRPSKAISDTIRWAVPRGWIRPHGRATYEKGRVGRTTLRYMRDTLARVRREAAERERQKLSL
jgi:hypothetical protein